MTADDFGAPGPLAEFGAALEGVLKQAMAQWRAAEPDDFAASEVLIGRGALRIVLTSCVGVGVPAELVFGVMDSESRLRVVSRMMVQGVRLN